MSYFGKKSEEKLLTLHPDIQRVLKIAIKIIDFTITDGLRTKEKQTEAVNFGNSKVDYPNSKHNRSKKDDITYNYNMSDAVDCVPYPIKWPDIKKQTSIEYVKRIGRFYQLAGVILAVAFIEGVKLHWGGNFTSFFDGPHYERVA